jgi:hypothetical protein
MDAARSKQATPPRLNGPTASNREVRELCARLAVNALRHHGFFTSALVTEALLVAGAEPYPGCVEEVVLDAVEDWGLLVDQRDGEQVYLPPESLLERWNRRPATAKTVEPTRNDHCSEKGVQVVGSDHGRTVGPRTQSGGSKVGDTKCSSKGAMSRSNEGPQRKRGSQCPKEALKNGFAGEAVDGDEPLCAPVWPKAKRGRRKADAFTNVVLSGSPATPAISATSGTPSIHWVQPSEGADGADEIRVVAPPTIDGGTSFKIATSPTEWAPELKATIANPRAIRGERECHLADHHGEVHDVTISFDAKVDRVKLLFRAPNGLEVAQLDIYVGSGRKGGFAILETKADALWRDGPEKWLEAWLDRASSWLKARRCPLPEEAMAVGWRTHKLELCTDFTGLRIFYFDEMCMTSRRKAKGNPKKRGSTVIRSRGIRPDGQLETMEVGERGRNRIAVETHAKTPLLYEEGTKPTESVYAPTWGAYGWNGEAEIRRVEIRARGTALLLRPRSKAKSVVDLSDPATLLNSDALNRYWRHATSSRTRLAVPGKGPLRKRATDPRWIAVQNAGGPDDGARWVQVNRMRARKLSDEEQRRKALDNFGRALDKVLRVTGAESLEDCQRVLNEKAALCQRRTRVRQPLSIDAPTVHTTRHSGVLGARVMECSLDLGCFLNVETPVFLAIYPGASKVGTDVVSWPPPSPLSPRERTLRTVSGAQAPPRFVGWPSTASAAAMVRRERPSARIARIRATVTASAFTPATTRRPCWSTSRVRVHPSVDLLI